MSSAETTELKLKTTPTGGVEAAHSPYYRRLLSAGYKGYLQGTIGGASLYGTIGLVIGGLTALAAAPFIAGGLAVAWVIVPAATGMGILKGATTFGNIGSTAAINAESADLAEQRRYLLDRYHDLPEGPEGDREAAEIRKELIRRQETTNSTPPFFHWKTVAICAAVGAVLAFGFLAFAPATMLAESGVFAMLHSTLGSAISSAAVTGIGAVAGALTGAVVGIDRYYVRKWFDTTEGIVYSNTHNENALMERSNLVSRLHEAARVDEVVKANIIRQQAMQPTPAPSAAPALRPPLPH